MPKGIVALVVLLIFSSSCANFRTKKVVVNYEVEEAIEVAEPVDVKPIGELGITDQKAKMASIFSYALIQNNEEVFYKYLPNVDVLRQVAGKETEGMTDKDIEEKMLNPLVNRFKTNFELLENGLEQNDVDRAKLSYKTYIYVQNQVKSFSPIPMEIMLAYKEEIISIPVTSVEIDGQCYLFEILKTTDVFSK